MRYGGELPRPAALGSVPGRLPRRTSKTNRLPSGPVDRPDKTQAASSIHPFRLAKLHGGTTVWNPSMPNAQANFHCLSFANANNWPTILAKQHRDGGNEPYPSLPVAAISS